MPMLPTPMRCVKPPRRGAWHPPPGGAIHEGETGVTIAVFFDPVRRYLQVLHGDPQESPVGHLGRQAPQRALRAVGRRHQRHQCLRLRRHRSVSGQRRPHRQALRGPPRHRRCAHRRPHRHLRRVCRRHPRAAPHPLGSLRQRPLQAQVHRAGPREIRAPHRSLPRARHRLFLLQRRQRQHGHGQQAVHDRRRNGLPAGLHRRTQDRRQRPAADGLLPGLRLRGQVRCGFHARSRARCRLDGAHQHQGVRAGSHGPPRRLDRRRRWSCGGTAR
ncbi:MAG: hypothetical protein RJB26_1891 [Pseudomonadota bacterium]